MLVKIFMKTSSEFQSVWVLFEEPASNVSTALLHSICPRWPRFVQDHPRWQSGSITMNPQDLFQHAQPLTPSLVHSKTIIMPADFTTVMGVVVWGGAGGCTSVFTHSWNGESHTLRLNDVGKSGCFRVSFIAEDVTWTLGTTSVPSYSFILHEDAISGFFLTISSGWNQFLAMFCA